MLKHLFLACSLVITPLISFAVYPLPVEGSKGMVVSSQYLASEVGIEILKKGGNAIDAAVAVGYALAVVYPRAGNLGGGGFMLAKLVDGRDIFLNFREKAPAAATKNMYIDSNGKAIANASTTGYLAVAVPGTVMGLNTALAKYGSLSLAEVMAPAIKLAEQGYILNAEDSKILQAATKKFAQQPNVAAIFLNNGQPYQAGERLIQSNLANSLKSIAKGGSKAFYQGKIANEIVKASQKNGGILSQQDFDNYTITESSPIFCTYRNYKISSAPPPSSGGVTLCEILNIVEGYPLNFLGWHSAMGTHFVIEAMRFAYNDRNNELGDPAFIENPVDHLISKDYAAEIRGKISPYTATVLPSKNTQEGTDTTHYSIVDNKGNAVAVTYTLNGPFGAGVIAGNTGFFLNNQMDDFTTHPGIANSYGLIQGEKNSIAPGKRPLSSMTPTIVSQDNKPFLVLGAPGGSQIITAVLQTILNVVDYEMDIKSAVDSPRFHFQGQPNLVFADPFTFSADTTEKLSLMNYSFSLPKWPLGYVEAIEIDPVTHIFYGASDDRMPLGAAIGF